MIAVPTDLGTCDLPLRDGSHCPGRLVIESADERFVEVRCDACGYDGAVPTARLKRDMEAQETEREEQWWQRF